MKTSIISLFCASAILAGCASTQSSRYDYFGYRNTLPASASEEAAEQQSEWQNPMRTTPRVAYIPVITPWYDIGMYGTRMSLGLGFSSFGFSPWAGYLDPYWSFYSYAPWGASFGFGFSPFYGSPFYRYNPYWGWSYIPTGIYSNVITGRGGDIVAPRSGALREFGSLRANSYSGASSTPYMGTFTSTTDGGGRSRSTTLRSGANYSGSSGGVSSYMFQGGSSSGNYSRSGSMGSSSRGSSAPSGGTSSGLRSGGSGHSSGGGSRSGGGGRIR